MTEQGKEFRECALQLFRAHTSGKLGENLIDLLARAMELAARQASYWWADDYELDDKELAAVAARVKGRIESE